MTATIYNIHHERMKRLIRIWNARLDIATIEENAKKLKEMFKPVEDAIEKTGKLLKDIIENRRDHGSENDK